MDRRLKLQDLLEITSGLSEVYFQPPENVSMSYPCIIYKIDPYWVIHASNQKYLKMRAYQITVIDRDPDSLIPDAIDNLPKSRFIRRYTVNGLNHDVFTLYY